MLRTEGGGGFEVFSAGTRPSSVRPEAIAVMKEIGIDISGHRSKSVDEFSGQSIDYDLIHDVVQAVKRNLKVDWTEPHRDAVRAEVRAAVRRVLRTREVRREHFDFLIDRIMEQAAALYADWPLAA